jgi:hypothetical protein
MNNLTFSMILVSLVFASTLNANDLAGFESASRVVVYYFNEEGSSIEGIFSPDGELSKTIASTRVLDSTQQHALFELLRNGAPEHMPYLCFKPRHAFVFEFDAAERQILEVCFECLTSRATAGIGTQSFNYPELGKFVHGIGLKLGPDLNLDELKETYDASLEHRQMLEE